MAGTMRWVLLILLTGLAGAQTVEDEVHINALQKVRPADVAVDKGLKYLAAQQHKSGAFPLTRNKLDSENVHATTALACLAFMSAGHFPERSQYGDAVRRGIGFIVARAAKHKGYLGGDKSRFYGHGACTIALASAYGMMPDAAENRQVGQALRAAVQVILDAQRRAESDSAGGWHYEATGQGADLSVSMWQILALRGARQCRVPVPAEAFEAAQGFLRRCYDTEADSFAYEPGGVHSDAMRAAGILGMSMLGTDAAADRERMVRAGRPLLATTPRQGRHFYYTLFYETLAANALGGEHSEVFLPRMRAALRPLQQENGAFDKHSGFAGGVYATSFALLCLCADYQYLPVFQE
jgi:hypothetical protein